MSPSLWTKWSPKKSDGNSFNVMRRVGEIDLVLDVDISNPALRLRKG